MGFEVGECTGSAGDQLALKGAVTEEQPKQGNHYDVESVKAFYSTLSEIEKILFIIRVYDIVGENADF